MEVVAKINQGPGGGYPGTAQERRVGTYLVRSIRQTKRDTSTRTRLRVPWGKIITNVLAGPSSIKGYNPTMSEGRIQDPNGLLRVYDAPMTTEHDKTPADFIDTPACELPVLPSKRRVQEMLGHLITFVEPTSFPKSRRAARVTEREVRRSLQNIDPLELDRLLREEREIG